jgi:hypothetical protein
MQLGCILWYVGMLLCPRVGILPTRQCTSKIYFTCITCLVFFLWDYRNKLLYGGPYHSTLRWIVYHHNLHMWYRVVYIGGTCDIGALLEVLSRWHKRNIWFLQLKNHFFGDTADIFSNFKWKFPFKISIESNFLISIFRGTFQLISFPYGGMTKIFKFQFEFQNQFFPFPSRGIANFFSKLKTNFFISYFSCGVNEFFLGLRLSNLLKNWKITYLVLQKIAYTAYPPPSLVVWSTVKGVCGWEQYTCIHDTKTSGWQSN